MVWQKAGMVGEMTDELLTMDEYQDMALATWARTPGDGDSDLAYLTLGMVGETGEVAEHIKKHLRHGDRKSVV